MNCGESLWCTRYFRNSFITSGSLELVTKLQEENVLLFPFINHSKSLQPGSPDWLQQSCSARLDLLVSQQCYISIIKETARDVWGGLWEAQKPGHTGAALSNWEGSFRSEDPGGDTRAAWRTEMMWGRKVGVFHIPSESIASSRGYICRKTDFIHLHLET